MKDYVIITKDQLLAASRKNPPEARTSSAVLLPFIQTEDGWDLLFEVRSDTVSQPGEVSLPGGHLEEHETPEEAVIRETCEELGLCSGSVELLGRLSREQIQGGRQVQSFVGLVDPEAAENIRCSDEVADAFRVPLLYFLETEPTRFRYTMEMKDDPDLPSILRRHLQVERPYGMTLYWEYDGYGIWGLTARILWKFLKNLRSGSEKSG